MTLPQRTNPSASLALTHSVNASYNGIFSADALSFVAELVERFNDRRDTLLAKRVKRQAEFDAGTLPDFRSDTAGIRSGEWKVAPIPAALQDRRVEITGPAEPKMIINALNSGAKMFMVDFEDSLSPTWEKICEGQASLHAAVRHTLTYASPEGKKYTLNEKIATLIVRPRGWHLPEKHVLCDGKPIAGAFLDFGLFFYHNAAYQAERGTGPVFLPSPNWKVPRKLRYGRISSLMRKSVSASLTARSRRRC